MTEPLLPIQIIHFDPVRRVIVRKAPQWYIDITQPPAFPFLEACISHVTRPADRIAYALQGQEYPHIKFDAAAVHDEDKE